MLVHRLNKDKKLPLLILSLRVDPHGEYVCLLDQSKRLLVVQVLRVCISGSRLHFKKTKEYSFHEQIPWTFQLEPSMKEQQIYDVSLSERQKQSQYLLFVYLKNIEIVILNINTKTVTKRHIYTLPYQIIHANIVGITIYVAMYNLTQATLNLETMEIRTEEKKIKLSQSTPQTKDTLRRKEIMRYFQQNGDCPRLWQSAGGMLMKGNQILAYEFIEQLDLSNSLEELQFREVKDYAPIKYELSGCKHYLIGGDNILHPVEQGGLFIVRSQLTNWSQVCELSSKPEINPYWTFYYKYDKEAKVGLRSKKNDKKDMNCDRFLIATYNYKEQEIVISWVVVDLQAKKKFIAGQGKDDTDRVRYSSTLQQITSLKNIKHQVVQIKWIGLTQFMYLERKGQLYFAEFQSQYLAY